MAKRRSARPRVQAKRVVTKKSVRATKRQLHPAGMKDPLLFVDTNVLLDFYRAESLGLDLLGKLEQVSDRLINTYQVEMEFKANRVSTIFQSIDGMQVMKPGDFKVPAFVSSTKEIKATTDRLKKLRERVAKHRANVTDILENPTTRDPVYKALQRLFRARTPYNLNRRNTAVNYRVLKNPIRALARKRFELGYPPRKPTNDHMGDAVNWEWIVYCAGALYDSAEFPGTAAERQYRDVIIVSRDKDYGTYRDNAGYPKDWLVQEFRSRTSKQGQLHLTRSLSEALTKWMNVTVDRDVADAERDQIEEAQQALLLTLPAIRRDTRRTRLRSIERMLDQVQSDHVARTALELEARRIRMELAEQLGSDVDLSGILG